MVVGEEVEAEGVEVVAEVKLEYGNGEKNNPLWYIIGGGKRLIYLIW